MMMNFVLCERTLAPRCVRQRGNVVHCSANWRCFSRLDVQYLHNPNDAAAAVAADTRRAERSGRSHTRLNSRPIFLHSSSFLFSLQTQLAVKGYLPLLPQDETEEKEEEEGKEVEEKGRETSCGCLTDEGWSS
eukprot:2716800-Rhodomonas_salina.1